MDNRKTGNRITGFGAYACCEPEGRRFCSGKRCGPKHSAITPDEMDAFRETAAALAEFFRDTTICCGVEALHPQNEPDDDRQLVLLVHPEEPCVIAAAQECWDYLDDRCGDYTIYSDVDVIFHGRIFIAYNPEDIVTLGGRRYLLGYAVVFEIDEDGNECSVNGETIRSFADYSLQNTTYLETEDGERFRAFRLD